MAESRYVLCIALVSVTTCGIGSRTNHLLGFDYLGNSNPGPFRYSQWNCTAEINVIDKHFPLNDEIMLQLELRSAIITKLLLLIKKQITAASLRSIEIGEIAIWNLKCLFRSSLNVDDDVIRFEVFDKK